MDHIEFSNLIEMLKKVKKIDSEINILRFIKGNADIQQLKQIVPYLYKRSDLKMHLKTKATEYNNIIFLHNLPASFTRQFVKEKILTEIYFELHFLAVTFDYFGNELCDFLTYRDNFECAFMKADFSQAKSIIETVNNQLGYSLWGISSLMASVSFSNTDMQQSQNHILESTQNTLVKAFVKMSGYRFSKDITGKYFQTQFKNIMDECDCETEHANLREAFKKYMQIIVDPTKNINFLDVRELIAISSFLPLIDKYCICEKIFGWLCSELTYDNIGLEECTETCAEIINQKLDHPFWHNILLLTQKCPNVIIKPEKLVVHEGLKLFCNKQFQTCYSYCVEKLQLYSNNFSLINLMAKCRDINQHDTPYFDIAGFIRKLYLKVPDSSDFVETIKMCDIYERFYSHFSFGTNLAVIIETETKPVMLHERKIYVRALIQNNYMPSKLAFFLPPRQRKKFVQNYKNNCGELYFSDWQISTYPEATAKTMKFFQCDEISLLLLEIKKVGIDNLQLNNTPYLKTYNRFLISQIEKYNFEDAIKRSSILEAINIYIRAFFESQWLVRKIDIECIKQKITIPIKRILEFEMSYCIYAFVTRYQLEKGETISNTVVKSCQNILKQNKKENPSALEWPHPREQLECKKLAYFLHYICTYDVLRRIKKGVSLAQDIYEERVAIINKVLQYYQECGSNAGIDALKREKKELMTEIECLDITRCINKGKINTRWIILSDEANEAVIYMYKKYIKAENNLYTTFIETFATVKKDYVQEINRILSINIRHGILESELFRFFKKGGITDEIPISSTNTRHAIAVFKDKIYSLLDELLEYYIMASHKFNNDKKLALYVEEDKLKQYFREMPPIIVEEDIRDYYLSILNTTLEKALPQWGGKICRLIDTTILDALKQLYASVDQDMKDNVNKIFDLWGEELEKLEQWFTVTQNQDIPYRLNTLGDYLKKQYDYLKISSTIDNDFIVSGNVINFLYTILRELIRNAEKYSNVSKNELNNNVTLQFFEQEEDLIITVKNKLSRSILKAKILKDIDDINATIKNAEKADKKIGTRKDIPEGRSGYKKIVKLLKRNYDEKYSIKPDFLEEEYKFLVTLSIRMEELC